MDNLEKISDVSLKRKVVNIAKVMDADGSGQEHYCTPKKFKNIETLDGYECHKIIREILIHGHIEANAEVIIEHKGQESVEDLIHLMFEAPTVTSEVEKFKEKINNSNCDLSDGRIVIENVVIPSSEATIFSCISNKNPSQGSSSLMLEEEEGEVEGLLKRLEDVEGYETESWGSSLNSTATPFGLNDENYSEDEKTLTLSQFLQDEADDEDEQLESVEGIINDNKEGCSSTLINDTSTHKDVIQLDLGEKAHTNSDTCTENTNNPEQSAHILTTVVIESTPDVANSAEVELYNTGCGNSAINMVEEPVHDTEITPDFVLEMVLAEGKANEALTRADYSATTNRTTTSSSKQSEEQQFEDFEYPYSSMCSAAENNSISQKSIQKTASDDIVDFIEELIHPSTSNRVDEPVETRSFVVEEQEVNTDNAGKSSKASHTKVKEEENASVDSFTSSKSSVADCSVVLERVEDMLNVNKCKTSDHKKTSNGDQTVDLEKLRQQVLERWEVWKNNKNIKLEKKNNETSMCSDVPNVSQIGVSSSTATASEVDSVQLVENESEEKNQDCKVSEDTHSVECEDVQKAAGVKESMNDNGVGFHSSNTSSDTNIAVDLNKREKIVKVYNSQRRVIPRRVYYTQKQLIAKMKSEMQKKAPNICYLSEWMAKTFERRKASLAESNYDLAEFVKLYPALKCYEIVSENILKYPIHFQIHV
ncbi:unnamed protein product [Orchesella dallaii]|uniref:Uncharacterized protein n=1 Tax=Orchesella dallaii TaxID=48710 RepID=A0ABP1QVZ7_9HEXA